MTTRHIVSWGDRDEAKNYNMVLGHITWASMRLSGSTAKDTQPTQGLRKGGKVEFGRVSGSQPDWLALCVRQGGWMVGLLNGSATSNPGMSLL